MINNLQDNSFQYKKMTLLGEGTVMTVPDMAIIQLGVQTQGENLEDIQSENARISQNVLKSLQQMGIKDIKTVQYTIDKNYVYENGMQIDKGYIVRNILEIRLKNIDQAGAVIDTSVANGANVIEYISFELSKPEFFYQEALNNAVMNAIQKATSIALYLGYPMAPVPVHITENSTQPIPSSQLRTFKEAVAATPIEPGQHQVTASVTIDFLY
jgi:Uncharacterized conserved protein